MIMKTTITVIAITPDGTEGVTDALAHALNDPMNYPDDVDTSDWGVNVIDGDAGLAAIGALDTIQDILSVPAPMGHVIEQVEAALREAGRTLPYVPDDAEEATTPRPSYDELMAFVRDVAACAPGENDDPTSEDQEALAGLAESAERIVAGHVPSCYQT
jgi:hypothetical protein